jgi:hypothetical protein
MQDANPEFPNVAALKYARKAKPTPRVNADFADLKIQNL